jgi:RNA polymerase sigma factor (sigma-70 family)
MRDGDDVVSAEGSDPLDLALKRLAAVPTDEEAWSIVYETLWPMVFAIVFRRLRGVPGLAEDAAQEVFLRLARLCPFERIRDRGGGFRPYIASMAHNVGKDYLRRFLLPPERPSDAPAEATGGDAVESVSLERLEAQELLEAIMSRLDKDERQILGLLLQGVSLTEIMQITGLTYTAAAVRIHRLRRKLGKYLKQQHFADIHGAV